MDTRPVFNQPKITTLVKKAKTLPEVVEELDKIASEWGGTTESIRHLTKEGRIREMEVTIRFKAV